MHSWDLSCTHAIGVPEGVTLLEFEQATPEEIQNPPEPAEEPTGGEASEEDLPECPDHRPATFLKGKPRCMLNPLFYKDILSTLIVYCIK
jgi:hypothetical protein